ncbi:MAG: hypothetical protein DRJ47_07865 [Thermoprotei archaeon]|nr:MAG: hypothetical protein DRJ47_07865 [Thermoprotei archaeon]
MEGNCFALRIHLRSIFLFIIALILSTWSFYVLSPFRSCPEASSLSLVISILISVGVFLCCFSGLLIKIRRQPKQFYCDNLKKFLLPIFAICILMYTLWLLRSIYLNLEFLRINHIDALFFIPVVFFIPGYVIIYCLDKESSLDLVEKIVFAVPFSMAVMAYNGFLLAILGTNFSQNILTIRLLLLIESISWILVYAFMRHPDRGKLSDLLEAVVVMGLWLLLFPAYLGFIYRFAPFSMFHGIMYAHYQNGVLAFNGKYEQILGALRKGSYPFLFSMFLAMLFSLSGEATIQWFLILSFFKPLELISYYLMVRGIFNKDTAMNATLLCIGMGFGGLLVSISSLSAKLNQIRDWMNLLKSVLVKVQPDTLSLIFLDVHPSIITAPMLYLSIYLVYNKDKFSRKSFLTLILLTLLTMHLTHIMELIIFSLFLTLWMIVNLDKNKDIPVVISCVIISGYLLELVIGSKPFSRWIGPISITFLPILLSILPKRFLNGFAKLLYSISAVFVAKKFRYIWIPVLSILIVVYLWLYPNINVLLKWYDHYPPGFGYWIIPLYMYPVKFGLSVIYFALLLTFYSRTLVTDRKSILFLIILFLTVLSQQVLSILHFYRLPTILAEMFPIIRRTPLEVLYLETGALNFWIRLTLFPLGGLFVTKLSSQSKIYGIVAFLLIWVIGFLTYLYNIILMSLSYYLIKL